MLLAGTLLPVHPATAGPPHETAQALSFEHSAQLLNARSDALSAASAGAEAARSRVEALKTLRLPNISINAQELVYQKTFNLSLQGVKGRAEGAASATLDDIAGHGVPGVPDDAVTAVLDEVHGALPGVFSAIPDSVSLRSRRTVFHPTVTAIMPLYAGGAISAAQDGAKAALDAAEADTEQARETLRLTLVQAYFGQVLAARVEAVARHTRDGFEHHLHNAHRLEAHGMISHARVLQVQVARDAAQRALDEARHHHATAVDTLANLLRSDRPIHPTTDLFVNSRALEPLDTHVQAALGDQPQLRKAEAATEAARQGVKLAHARRLPSIYAFGQYNLNRRHALATEPDWIIGIGVHYALTSGIGRGHAESAARARQRGAEAVERQARIDIRSAISKSYHLVETARSQFLSLDSSIAAATESLRVQEVSFREGVASATDVIDARNALAQVRTRRAASAYKYDVALAALLLASGEGHRFTEYLRRADIKESP